MIVNGFLAAQGVLLKHFGNFVESVTGMIREGAARAADRLQVPARYLESARVDKEKVAQQLFEERTIRSGAVCLLSTVEPCSSWQVFRSRAAGTQQLQRRLRKCLHQYHYLVDRDLGWCHVRVQTWMPYTVQVCINGREWLGRQIDRQRLRYVRDDNCFPHLGSPDRVQQVMDRMLTLSWPSILGDLVHRANPALATITDAVGANYYWTVHQAEWATDVMFHDSACLARSYRSLVRHAINDSQSHDVLRFLAKPSSANYRGEVTTDYKPASKAYA